MSNRPIHLDFQFYLDLKDQSLIKLYEDLRNYILELYPESNELLYHTHALTSVYSISEKLGDAFVLLPIYTNHVNLGFNKGSLLKDKHNLLQGTGKLIRHIPVSDPKDYRNAKVKSLVQQAIKLAIEDMNKPTKSLGKVISKIKK